MPNAIGWLRGLARSQGFYGDHHGPCAVPGKVAPSTPTVP